MSKKVMFAIRLGTQVAFVDDKARRASKDLYYAYDMRFDDGYCPFKTALDGDLSRTVFGFMDDTGKPTIMPYIDHATRFSEGMCAVTTMNNELGLNRWGYVDTNLELTIPALFRRAGNFTDGVAVVSVDDQKYGVIDKDCEWVIKPRFEFLKEFIDGVACAEENCGEMGLINKQGEWVVEPKYRFLESLGDGMVLIHTDKGYKALMTTTGEHVGDQAKFNHIGKFNNGVAPACEKFLWGYINTKGEWVVEPKYHKAGEFSEGRAVIEEFIPNPYTNGPSKMVACGLINEKFEVILEPKYRQIGKFKDGYAYVQTFESWGRNSNYIDKEGNLFISEDKPYLIRE